jgi:2-polyprenyl-3-methyl-5-hydroxy-6-metoxy-1,4-benzoquinol methylase
MRILPVAALLLARLCFAQTNEDRIWASFVEWMKTPAAPDHPAELLKAYTAKLFASGMSEGQAKAQLDIVQKRAMKEGDAFTALRFDKMYSSPNAPFNPQPSAFLARAIDGVKPGKALDVAMGQGRNSIYLATKGWDVTGYDLSPGGLAVARDHAAKAGVKINTVLKTHQEFDFGSEQWDLVVMIYPLISMDDAAFLKRVRSSVKPGGMVLVEQFNAAPVPGARGPANALFKTFQDFRVVRYEDVEDIADWGNTAARIGRILAVKE